MSMKAESPTPLLPHVDQAIKRIRVKPARKVILRGKGVAQI